MSNYGCTDSTHIILDINNEFVLFIPNAFTPELNGLNNVFYIQGKGISANGFHLWIYNRTGEMVFESKSINIGWDGKFQNVFVPFGVYIYKLSINDFNGNNHVKYGEVTVVR